VVAAAVTAGMNNAEVRILWKRLSRPRGGGGSLPLCTRALLNPERFHLTVNWAAFLLVAVNSHEIARAEIDGHVARVSLQWRGILGVPGFRARPIAKRAAVGQACDSAFRQVTPRHLHFIAVGFEPAPAPSTEFRNADCSHRCLCLGIRPIPSFSSSVYLILLLGLDVIVVLVASGGSTSGCTGRLRPSQRWFLLDVAQFVFKR
jgi:hypothetical protein